MFRRFRADTDEFFRSASADLGPLLQRDLDLAEAMANLDETGDVSALADTPWPSNHGGLISALGLRGAVEFVVAAWAAERDEAADALAWLTRVIGEPARTYVRALTEDPRPVIARTAAEILGQIPIAPTARTRIQLFGPSTLLRDDTEVDDPDWRRENVRALFAFLVVHPNTTRDQIMAALWPEADEPAARRSLRTVLNLLHRVLEPEREGGDATFFIRADRSTVRLVHHPTLSVDAWEFDRLVDDGEAKLADGVPSLAIEPLQAALDLYRGDFLAGVPAGDWHQLDRDRYVARFVAAAVRVADLCSAYGRVDDALAAAQRALTVEPWSEPAHRALIAAHLANDDRASARRSLERCEAELADFGGISEEATEMLIRRLDP
jgi:DNA-binding SARP family transcriptional activator